MIRTGLKFYFVLVVMLFITPTAVFASAKGSAFYEFLEDPINSRSIGMGTAGTAVPDNRGFSFYNPALPAINKHPYVSFDYSHQYEDLGRGQAEFAWTSQKWFIDLGFLSQSSGDFQVSDEQGVKEGVTGTSQSSLGIIGGGFRKDSYSFGITLSGVQDKIYHQASYGLVGNAGAIFNIIPEKLYGGLAVFNVGRSSSYLDSTHELHGDNLPLTFRAGLSWNDKFKAKYPYTIAADVVYSKNYQKVMVPVGVEFWLLPALAIRVGKRFNFDSDLFSIGTGLRLENIGFDAAFTPTRVISDVGLKWSMGITYYLASPKKKAEKTVKAQSGDSVKTPVSDTVKTVAPDKKVDSIPEFKAPVERKIIRNKVIVTDEMLIDSSKAVDSTKKDSVTVPAKNDSVPSLPADSTKSVTPLSSGVIQEKEASQSADEQDSLVTSDIAVPASVTEPELKAKNESQADSTEIIDNNKAK